MVASSLGPYELVPGSSWPLGPGVAAEGTAPDGGRVLLRRSSPALVAAASSAPHPHLLRPVDLLVDDEGEMVVVSDEPGGERLDVWTRRRGTMTAGEAVTVLLPVLAAVAHLARRGTVLDGIGLEDVVLDARGAPVLVGGSIVPHAVPSPETVTAAAGAFVEAVARELPPRDRARLRGEGGVGASLDDLLERVHDLAPPVALPTIVPSPDVTETGVVWSPPPEDRATSWWTSVLPESALLDGLADWWQAVSVVPVVDRLRSVRPRSWALGGLVVVSLVIGATALPRDAGSHSPGTGTPPRDVTSSAEPVVTASDTVADEPAPDEFPVTPLSPEEAAVQGDDAVAAAAVLLRARIACVREPSTSCVAAVDQPGSPVAAVDAGVMVDPSTAADLVLPTTVESELQRLGETVLLDCRTADDEPASVLVVRTEAGWRLREVMRR